MSNNQNERTELDKIKIIFLGHNGVGKTNLIYVTIGKEFNQNIESTCANTFYEKKILLDDRHYTLKLWDTIGQKHLRRSTRVFYKDSKIVVFAYDIAWEDSFKELDYWTKDIEKEIGSDITKGIIACKSDLYMNKKISVDEGEEYAKSIGAKFLLFSSKTDNAQKMENFLAELLREYLIKIRNVKNKEKIALNYNDKSKPKRNNNCAK